MALIAATLATAFLLDYSLGDPVYRLHPVRGIGTLIRKLEIVLRRAGGRGVVGGFILMISVVTIALTLYVAVRFGLARLHEWVAICLDIFIVYSCLALRDMVRHARPVAVMIRKQDLSRARELVQRIVGRDVSKLDLSQVARATVESVAESFVDGFLAPVFWFVVFGVAGVYMGYPLPFAVAGLVIYRCVNTLDSMVGYHNEKYELFGRFSARTDDILNFVPARLSLLLFVPTAALCGMNAAKGWRVALRDRHKHASPNSAHAESFLAGVLGRRLGGPTVYSHGTVDKPWIGDGNDPVESIHIVRACNFVMNAGCLLVMVILITGYFYR